MSKAHNELTDWEKRKWEIVRQRVFARARYRCAACGAAGRLEADHIQPICEGGPFWDERNIQALCRSCHIAKTRRDQWTSSEDHLAQLEAWDYELARASGQRRKKPKQRSLDL